MREYGPLVDTKIFGGGNGGIWKSLFTKFSHGKQRKWSFGKLNVLERQPNKKYFNICIQIDSKKNK